MNHAASKALELRLKEVERLGGLEAYRLHALQHLQVKTIVKESHGTPLHTLCFNQTGKDGELASLFATVGKDQATVYTDAHMTDHIGVVVQLENQASEFAQGGELQAACWLNVAAWTPHPHGDAALAVSGADTNISVISVVEARVVKLLQGHSKEVVELAAAPAEPHLLLSLSKDGNVRLWDVPEEACLASINTDATAVALAPDGASFVAGNAQGRLHRYAIEAAVDGRCSIAAGSKTEMKPAGGSHSEPIDCIVR
jgi:WD40 repeat protein